MEYRKLRKQEIGDAVSLVCKVFSQFEASNYSEEGKTEFYKSIHDPAFLEQLTWLGAFDETSLVGVIATRNQGSHIASFFIDGNYHHQGIGRALFSLIVKESKEAVITVNASIYAQDIYRHLGFIDTMEEQNVHGLRFIPMKLELQRGE